MYLAVHIEGAESDVCYEWCQWKGLINRLDLENGLLHTTPESELLILEIHGSFGVHFGVA